MNLPIYMYIHIGLSSNPRIDIINKNKFYKKYFFSVFSRQLKENTIGFKQKCSQIHRSASVLINIL